MEKRSPEKRRLGSVQLRLHLLSANEVGLEGAIRHEIVQILAQLLASAVAAPPATEATRDEAR